MRNFLCFQSTQNFETWISSAHRWNIYFFSGVKRQRRHFLLEMPQIASRGNFIVTRISARPIDRTTFCQSGSQMPESTIDSRGTTRPRIWKRSQPGQYSTLARQQRLSILMDISKCATTLPIFFLSYVDSAPCPRRGSVLTSSPFVPTYAHGTPGIVDEECQGKRHHSQGLSCSLNNRYRTLAG